SSRSSFGRDAGRPPRACRRWRSPRPRASSRAATTASTGSPRPSDPQSQVPIPAGALVAPRHRAPKNSRDLNALPETAMLMTLAMPAELQAEEDTRPAAPVRIKVRSADELRTAVRHSRLQALTLDGTAMTHILRFDAKRGVLEVQAAATWAELAKYLAGRKLNIDAFAATPGLPAIVGEAVSGAAPGPDGLPVSAHVIGLTLVTPDGELRRADRETNAELLHAALGGQGVIGLLYSVTFALASLAASAADATAPVALDIPQSKPTHAAEYAFETLVPPAAREAYLADVRALAEERRLTLLGLSVRRYR